MTFFTEVNEEAKSGDPSQASLGPRAGFMDAFDASWNAQVRTSAQSGMWAAFADEEDKQLRAMKEAGIENMPRIGMKDLLGFDTAIFGDDDFFLYKRAARFYAGDGDEREANRLREFDTRMDELKKQYPDLGLRTGRELFEEVIRKGREAEDTMNNMRTTFGGKVGEFLGGGIASMSPRTDEFNAMTLGVGGPGKTALARIAAEAGLQGVVELGNQVTGVQEQRQMMGLSSGAGDVAARVAGTALIGGTFQAAGEGLAYAGKRWFRNSDIDPAPPAPDAPTANPKEPLLLEYKPKEWEGMQDWERDVREYQEGLIRDLINGTRDYTDDVVIKANYGQTRRGAARARLDMDHVASRLDAWDGELPYQIRPRTDTAIPQRVDSVNFRNEVDIHAQPKASLDAAAREVDPKLFRVYDDLADRKAEFQRWLSDPRYKQEQAAAAAKSQQLVDELSSKIDNLKYNMGKVGNRRRAEMQTKLDKLLAERADAVEKAVVRDTPEMAVIRRELMDTDFKMRDMYPEVSRAYAHARSEWELDAPNREAIRSMIREGRKDIGDTPLAAKDFTSAIEQYEKTLHDKAPILRETPKVEAQLREGADAADIAQTIIRENMKIMDEALDSYRASLDKIVSSEKNGEITLNGERFKFDLDKDTIYVPLDDGTGVKRMTIRELLEDNADVEAELKATQTCSIV